MDVAASLGTALAPGTQSAPNDRRLRSIDAAARDFEAMFLSQMLSPVFDGLQTDNPFGGGFGEEMYGTFLVEEIGKAAARGRGLGIADAVRREMLRAQEART
jgi:peptidoglycan hydrolase FlgJ